MSMYSIDNSIVGLYCNITCKPHYYVIIRSIIFLVGLQYGLALLSHHQFTGYDVGTLSGYSATVRLLGWRHRLAYTDALPFRLNPKKERKVRYKINLCHLQNIYASFVLYQSCWLEFGSSSTWRHHLSETT